MRPNSASLVGRVRLHLEEPFARELLRWFLTRLPERLARLVLLRLKSNDRGAGLGRSLWIEEREPSREHCSGLVGEFDEALHVADVLLTASKNRAASSALPASTSAPSLAGCARSSGSPANTHPSNRQ
jgi:hypothetical protein